jgi:hypothetical protein
MFSQPNKYIAQIKVATPAKNGITLKKNAALNFRLLITRADIIQMIPQIIRMISITFLQNNLYNYAK